MKDVDIDIYINNIIFISLYKDTPFIDMDWCDEHENLLKEWAEKARFYSWMHHKTSVDYNRLNSYLTLPLIIISTINGSANFTLVGNKENGFFYSTIFPLIIGTMSIITAVLSSSTKFLKTAELKEKHMLFYRQFNILVRNICLELSLPREQRKPPSEILNINRHEFDRMVNEAPNIPEHIIVEFNKRFPCSKNKPEIANVFDKINIHGRDKDLKDRETYFKTMRQFKKWRNSQTVISNGLYDNDEDISNHSKQVESRRNSAFIATQQNSLMEINEDNV